MAKVTIYNHSGITHSLPGNINNPIKPGVNLVEQSDWESAKDHLVLKKLIDEGTISDEPKERKAAEKAPDKKDDKKDDKKPQPPAASAPK